jgi:hypothetical protein
MRPGTRLWVDTSLSALLRSAYIATVVADPEGDDLAPGAGEHVVLRNSLDVRNDLGGGGLRMGTATDCRSASGTRVHTACGEDTAEAVFNCLETEVLGDDGDVLVLRDAAGTEVHRFAYGRAAD